MTDKTTAVAHDATPPTAPRPARPRTPPLRAPKKKFPYRTLREMLLAWRWGLARLALVLVILVLAVGRARPFALGLVEEQLASGAVAQGRVLLRGAQQVATVQMTEFRSIADTEAYLTTRDSLGEIVTVAAFEVAPVEVLSVSLDSKGIIDKFECVLDYEQRRYQISYDLDRNVATPTLLEKLEKPADTK